LNYFETVNPNQSQAILTQLTDIQTNDVILLNKFDFIRVTILSYSKISVIN